MKKIIIICKGGFGKEMEEYLKDTFSEASGYLFSRMQDLYPDDDFTVQADEVFVVANGEPAIKAKLVKKIQQAGGTLLSVIHPTCYVAASATIGEGAILCPFAFVGPFAVLAPHVTLNVNAGVGHNAKVGSFTVFSPYASAAGAAIVGERVFLGSYAFVAPEKRIGDNAKLSAGAFALSDVPQNSLAVGNPARVFPEYYSPQSPPGEGAPG